MKWVKNNYDFKYLVRSNSSTYVNIKEVEKLLVNYNTTDPLYAGRPTNFNNQFNYVHGSCIILNKASVSKILENEQNWDHRLIDDSALGKLFDEIDINLKHKEVFHVNSKILLGDLIKMRLLIGARWNFQDIPDI